MASVDLKDAFYTMPIHTDHQKFLKFKRQEHCYAFRGMLNGYSEAMRVFVKRLKPPISILRSHCYLSVVFVDDSYLQGRTFSTCEDNVNSTVHLLQSLGFTIHPEKSVLFPTQKIEFLGSLIATFPVLPYGKFHYRELERCKIFSLKFRKGKYNAPFMPLSISAIAELHWWLKHLKNANQSLQDIPIDCTIQTDASERDGVRQMEILQLVADGVLWRETILIFWN